MARRKTVIAIGLLLTIVEAHFSACAAERKPEISVRQAVLSPPLSALEQQLFDEIARNHFGRFSLLQAGLIAGGIDRDADLQRYGKKFDALVDTLHRSGKVRGTPREQAQAIFEFLHKTLLHGGYSLQASDMRLAFDRGRFNCVTASLLFDCLTERFGLKAAALELPGHAMSRLELPEETLDIETTCPEWFSQSGKLPGAPNIPAALRPINDVQLVATIYYNRGVDLLAERRFAEAAAANAKAVRLDPENATVKGNYLATINNWGIALGVAGEYEKAAELFRIGMSVDPAYETFRDNYVRFVRQWSGQLCRAGRQEEALRLLDKAAEEHPNEGYFREAAIEIVRRSAARQTAGD